MADDLNYKQQRHNEIMGKYYREHPQYNGECDSYQNKLADRAARWESEHGYDDDGWGGPIDG